MSTRIAPDVCGNSLGQHSAERNQDAADYAVNLDPQNRSSDYDIEFSRSIEKNMERSLEGEREEDQEEENDRDCDGEHGRDHLKDHDRDQSKDRSRDHERDRDRDRDRNRNRERDRDRERDHERDRERDRGRDRARDHERGRDRHRDRDRDRGRERNHERDRDTDRSKDHDADRSKDHDTDRSNHDTDRSKGQDTDRSKGHDTDRSRDHDTDRSKEHDMDRNRDHDSDRSPDHDRDRNRDRDRDREHHHRDRDHHRERSERREHAGDRNEDGFYRKRDHDRRRSYDWERDERHRRSSRSHSRYDHKSKSRSRSRSKSKRVSGFDLAPPVSALGGVSAAAAFAGQLSGPSSTSVPGMFPNMFPSLPGQQFGTIPVMPIQAMTQQATRHARRVYVGGLSPTANEQTVATYFSQVMAAIEGNTAGPGDAVVNVYINHEKKFAFVEMRSVEEASNAMALDGIIFEGAPVKVRRPSDYNPSLAATLGPSQPNQNLNLAAVGLSPGSAGGLEGPDRVFVGGLPYYFTESQIRELLESFGPLRGFDLVKDRETGNSKGYAFCVYQDLSVTDIACAALNGIKMGDKTLTVRRANQGSLQPRPEQESVLLHAQQQVALQRLMMQPGVVVTKVVCLTEVVSQDELRDDDEYEDILEDMRQEGGKFGAMVNVVIPRPTPDGYPVPGTGKVFLEYEDMESASKARSGMNGRKFGGNQVVAVFFSEEKFAHGDYDG